MRVALTGATGFTGRHIVEQLTLAGHDVRCLVRPGKARWMGTAPKVQTVAGDLGDTASLVELMAGCDAVVHSAAWHEGSLEQVGRESAHEHLEKNVLGSLRLLQLAREAPMQFIFISSGSVFGDPPGDAPLVENSPRAPVNAYGAYKTAVEVFCQAYNVQFGVNACILRPFRILGLHEPLQRSPFYDLVECVMQGDELHLSKSSKYVFVEDVARAVAFVLGRRDFGGEAFNLCDGWVSQRRIAQMAMDLVPSKATLGDAKETPPRHLAAADRIKALGFEFVGEKGLQLYVQALVAAVQEQISRQRGG